MKRRDTIILIGASVPGERLEAYAIDSRFGKAGYYDRYVVGYRISRRLPSSIYQTCVCVCVRVRARVRMYVSRSRGSHK